jgi:hypothetical protein
MWWNFTEYSVKYIYNVWHLWEANNCYRVLGKNLGYIYIYIYIYGMVLQLFTECTVKKWHCCSPSIVLQIVH